MYESCRVMLIDDNEADNVYHELVLRRAGFGGELVVHESAELALASLNSDLHPRKSTLIFLDINMPGMDGYQVIEVLKNYAQTQSIPIIAVTANAIPRDIDKGAAAGLAAYITKPLDVGKFLAAVDRCLEQTPSATG